MISIYSIIL